MQRAVDIIIPTFNAYEHAAACVSSVLSQTTGIDYRLILINDASTDERIDGFYKSLAGGNILYLKNEINLGFVKSCNRGMKQSEMNDVLFLNTDTLVTKDWLKNLQKAVYQKPDTGGAIPLSNHASVYSIPELSRLESESIQKAGEILSAYETDEIHEIPTAVGFCFYVKREVIRQIGYFDEIFGRGYGEENDFCMRAREKGFRFILVDNAFVYHEGHVSMSAAGILKPGQFTLSKHEKILNERYPYYRAMNEKYLQSGVLDRLKEKVKDRLRQGNPPLARKILFYLHHPIDGRSTGGAEFHVADLVRSFRDIYTCYVTYIRDNRVFVEEYTAGLRITFLYDLPCPPFFLSLENPLLQELYQNILKEFEIDILHVHLTMNNSLDIIHAAKSLALPVFMTLHDYYAISPDFNLLYKFKNGKWQGEREPLMEYFFAYYGFWGVNVQAWRRKMAGALRLVDELIFPSESALKEFRKIFWRTNGVKVIEHGAPYYCQKSPMDGWKDKSFSVCFLGYSQAPQKGYAMIKKIIPRLLHQNIPVHMLGTEAHFWKKFLGDKNFHVHGTYKREEVIAKLQQIKPNLIGILSIWHETYAYTLTEAWAAGIPAMVGPLGATAERVGRHGGGVVLKDFEPSGFLNEVLRLKYHRKLYQKLVDEVNNLKLRSLEEAKQDYQRLYESYFKNNSAKSPEVPPVFYSSKTGEQNFKQYAAPKVRNYGGEVSHRINLLRAALRRFVGRLLYGYLDCFLNRQAPPPECLSIEPGPIPGVPDAQETPLPEIDVYAK